MATPRQLMTLFSKLGTDDDTRHDMIFRFTGGRTQSTRQLTDREIETLVGWLQEQLPMKGLTSDRDLDLAIRRKRSLVLKLATETGIKASDSWHRFNAWMLKYSVEKKPLNRYNYEELDGLIRQFRGLKANYERSAKRPGTKAWYEHKGFERPGDN